MLLRTMLLGTVIMCKRIDDIEENIIASKYDNVTDDLDHPVSSSLSMLHSVVKLKLSV